MDHRKVRKIYWICWLLASVIVVLGALLPDAKNCNRYWNNNCYFWKYYCNLFYEMSLL